MNAVASRSVLVLGMHRSGTSCLAGLLRLAGWRPPGAVVRNWDNRHGHHEATAVVRLNEEVLAANGGHWQQPPDQVRWSDELIRIRDDLLAAPGGPWLLKDPRTLLVLPFWLAVSPTIPAPALVGIVRHPLAVARSLRAQRGLTLDQGLALWLAHNRALVALAQDQSGDGAGGGLPILDFDAPKDGFLIQAAQVISALAGRTVTPDALASAYDAEQVHQDGGAVGDGGDPGLRTKALDLHQALLAWVRSIAATPAAGSHATGHPVAAPASAGSGPRSFPWPEVDRALGVLATSGPERIPAFLDQARAALRQVDDGSPVLSALAGACLRAGAGAALIVLLDACEQQGPPLSDERLAALLRGKAEQALGHWPQALAAFDLACAGPDPYFEARHLRAHALRRNGLPLEAGQALADLADEALHPQQVWATLGEWTAEDGDPQAAIHHLERAVAAAPRRRRGRLRCRLADLLLDLGRKEGALDQVRLARLEDPGHVRSRVLEADLAKIKISHLTITRRA